MTTATAADFPGFEEAFEAGHQSAYRWAMDTHRAAAQRAGNEAGKAAAAADIEAGVTDPDPDVSVIG